MLSIDKLITWSVKHNISNEALYELVSLQGLPDIAARLAQINVYREKLAKLKSLPMIVQRSPEWHDVRKQLLTASDLGQALNRGKFGNRDALINKKAGLTEDLFNGNIPPLKWGTMYEPVALSCYQSRHLNIDVHEFGLVRHPNISVFGASPDGITDTGIMIELKCPWRRVIKHDEVPEQYMLQIQGQLEVCDLDECDYVECVLQEMGDRDHYLATIAFDATVDHGIVLEYSNLSYAYSPINLTPLQALKWCEDYVGVTNADPTKLLCTIHFWKLNDINIVRVMRDKKMFDDLKPLIIKFWGDVEEKRLLKLKDGEKQTAVSKKKRVKKEPTTSFMFDDSE